MSCRNSKLTVTILDARHELAEVLLTDEVRHRSSTVKQIEELAVFAQVQHENIYDLSNTRATKRGRNLSMNEQTRSKIHGSGWGTLE